MSVYKTIQIIWMMIHLKDTQIFQIYENKASNGKSGNLLNTYIFKPLIEKQFD